MKAVRLRDLGIQILRPRLKVNILMKGFMNLLVKSGPRDFNRQDEPETEQKIAFAHVELNILSILTYCLSVVFAPC